MIRTPFECAGGLYLHNHQPPPTTHHHHSPLTTTDPSATAQLAQLATADGWLGADKAEHLVACAAVVVAVYACLARLASPLGRNASLTAAVLTSLLLGGLKELGDGRWWPGNRSVRDAAADVAGIVLGAGAVLTHHHLTAAAASTGGSSAAALTALGSRLRPAGAGRYQAVPTTATAAADIEMGLAGPPPAAAGGTARAGGAGS
jgi:uncharacterized protein YfiM (DUF2279 family)